MYREGVSLIVLFSLTKKVGLGKLQLNNNKQTNKQHYTKISKIVKMGP